MEAEHQQVRCLHTEGSAGHADSPIHAHPALPVISGQDPLGNYCLDLVREGEKAPGFCLVCCPGPEDEVAAGSFWSWGLPGWTGAGHLYMAIRGSSAMWGSIHLTSISSPMKASRMATSSRLSLWGGHRESGVWSCQGPHAPGPAGPRFRRTTGGRGAWQGLGTRPLLRLPLCFRKASRVPRTGGLPCGEGDCSGGPSQLLSWEGRGLWDLVCTLAWGGREGHLCLGEHWGKAASLPHPTTTECPGESWEGAPHLVGLVEMLAKMGNGSGQAGVPPRITAAGFLRGSQPSS